MGIVENALGIINLALNLYELIYSVFNDVKRMTRNKVCGTLK